MVAPLVIGAALELARFAAPRLIRHLTDSEDAAHTAERVISIAQEVTGTSSSDAALARLKADPNLVMQFNIRTQEIEAELERAYLLDRQNARSRDIEFLRAGQVNKRADLMVFMDVVGLMACLYFLWAVTDAPGEVRGLVATIAAYFGLGLRDAHQFEFGSSRGSKQKDDVLARKQLG